MLLIPLPAKLIKMNLYNFFLLSKWRLNVPTQQREGEKEKDRKEDDKREEPKKKKPDTANKDRPAQLKRQNSPTPGTSKMKAEDSENEVEYIFKVKSTYKTCCEGIMKRRQLKMEMEMKAKENRLRLANYWPQHGYMQWHELLAMYGPMEMDDGDGR